MQVNNSEFFTPAGGNSSAKAERPGDGLFDALLRAEEARYEEARYEEPHARDADRGDDHRREAEWSDKQRPEDDRFDDYDSDVHHADDYGDEGRPEQDPSEPHDDDGDVVADPVDPADSDTEDQPAVAEADGAPAEGDSGGVESDAAGDENESTPLASPAAAGGEAREPNAETAPGQPAAGALVDKVASAADGTRAQTGTPTTQAQAAANPAPAAAVTAEANTPAASGTNGTATTSTTAQGVAATAAAAKHGVADKPAAKAQQKASPGAAAQAPAAPTSDHKTANGPATIGTQGKHDDLLVTTSQAGLTSKPTSSLAGAAATAAMVEQAKPATTAANSGERGKGKAGATAAPAVNGPQKSTAPQAKTAQMTDPSASGSKSDRSFIAAGPVGGMATENLGTANSGGQTQPALTVGSVPGGGSVQNASFTDALANAQRNGAPAPAEQIAVQVQKAQQAGKDQLNIKLHPAELGRIEVKLESGDDGVLRAVISAERSETLDLLQRDSRGLERALQDAGVKTDSGSLSFNLKGQQQQADQDAPEGQTSSAPGEADAKLEDPAATPPPPPGFARHDGALDIRV